MSRVKAFIMGFNKLSQIEQHKIMAAIMPANCSSNNKTISQYLSEHRFADRVVCPICGSAHIKRNGFRTNSNGKVQRYKCLDCLKHFTIGSNSITSRTRKNSNIWYKYIEYTLLGISLRKIAQLCGINKNTAFVWRHKMLDALQNMAESVNLTGIIEADETFFNVSYKGNHSKSKKFKMPRKPHRRGNDVHTRGLSDEKVCIPCAINRAGLSVSKMSNLAKIKIDGLEKVLSNKIESGSVIVADKEKAYRKYSANHNLKLYALKAKTESVKGVYNLQTINAFHGNLKRLVNANYRGVSSKYLNNYLILNNFINHSKGSFAEKCSIFMEYVLCIPFSSTCRTLNDRDPLPLLA